MAKKKHIKVNKLEDLDKVYVDPEVEKQLSEIELENLAPVILKKKNSKEYKAYYIINEKYVPEEKALVMIQEMKAVKEYRKYKALKWKYRAHLTR